MSMCVEYSTIHTLWLSWSDRVLAIVLSVVIVGYNATSMMWMLSTCKQACMSLVGFDLMLMPMLVAMLVAMFFFNSLVVVVVFCCRRYCYCCRTICLLWVIVVYLEMVMEVELVFCCCCHWWWWQWWWWYWCSLLPLFVVAAADVVVVDGALFFCLVGGNNFDYGFFLHYVDWFHWSLLTLLMDNNFSSTRNSLTISRVLLRQKFGGFLFIWIY